ncbi:MAG: FAD-binding protein [Ruminococcaceae bacterium]|jgi:succinate dehydrogenase/fumarate reductase flavoprotein subunit|nr:FAD-binding protein [Oscillospiraceae bacterium]
MCGNGLEKRSFPGRIVRVKAVIVGSGAAAFNAALSLCRLGMRPGEILLVTEGVNMGASRNTGSDKQTYYKLSTGANVSDSVMDMARDYFACGSMHGDLALTEAAGSLRGFFRLVSLGVPFPADRYGEYTGYKTDHDPRMRASSCGPLTSKHMTEALESACRRENVPLCDGRRAVRILTSQGQAVGIVAVGEADVTAENPAGLSAVLAGAVIWATGGPSAVYGASVYPESQTGSLGPPLLAGAGASNLTESQYGLASVDFRWNLSGSYQQVLPRYISVDGDGSEREFLPDALGSAEEAVRAQFLKGYEWPFNPANIGNRGGSRSSEVDIAVYRERSLGREVYLDFRRSPSLVEERGLTPETIGETAYRYLEASRALGDSPVRRLRQMNEKAYRLYLDHGIDLEKAPLRTAVCAQHLNGGLSCTLWYESPDLPGLYPVGECAGVFGVKRPGGSALNSTQVSSQRAAEKIAFENRDAPLPSDPALADQLSDAAAFGTLLTGGDTEADEILALMRQEGLRHDRCAAFLRNREDAAALMEETNRALRELPSVRVRDSRALLALLIRADTLTARYAMLSAIVAYIDDGGLSRGSFLVEGAEADGLDRTHASSVLETRIGTRADGSLSARNRFVPVRPIPEADNWFENVYNAYDSGGRFADPDEETNAEGGN